MNEFIQMLRIFSPLVSNTNTNETKRTIITRLKFIGTIQPHEKIDSRTLKVESPTIFTPLKRFLYGDSRDTTVHFFSSTIDRAFEIVDANINSSKTSDKMFCANIIADLVNSIKGLNAAQQTYSDDKLIVCELETITESIQRKIYELQKQHPDIFTLNQLSLNDNINKTIPDIEKQL